MKRISCSWTAALSLTSFFFLSGRSFQPSSRHVTFTPVSALCLDVFALRFRRRSLEA